MKAIPTDVLSKELMEREGVISITVKEFEKIEVAGVVVAGPAVILINQDYVHIIEIKSIHLGCFLFVCKDKYDG